MKVSKKLFFLLCIAFNISVSYGMLDEETQKKIKLYTPNCEHKKIQKIVNKPIVNQYKRVIFICSKEYSHSPRTGELGDKIIHSPIDIVTTDDNASYAFMDLTNVAAFFVDECINAVQKQKSFWEHHPIPCLSLAFLAGGCITLKIYNTFYGKQ